MKKKICMILLAAAMAVSAASCSSKQEEGTEDTKTDNSDKETGSKGSVSTKGEVSKADQITYKPADCVTLGDYSALEVTLANSYEVTKEQVDDYAQRMAEYYVKVYKDTDKTTVEEGDIANIDYVGKKDGIAFQGGTANGYHLEIGSGGFIDGFEDGLIGKKVGETVDLNLTFPEEYPQNPDLAGQPVVFTVTIHKIEEIDEDAKIELTDEMVKENFNYDTVKEYKKMLKEYLENMSKSNETADTRQAVINKLMEICEVKIPDGLLEARVDDAVQQFTDKNCSGDMTLEKFLDENLNGMTVEEYRSEVTTDIETTLKTELILGAIADKEGIELDEEAYKEYVEQQIQNNNYESEEAFYEEYGVNAASGEKYQRNFYVCNKALDMVVENTKTKSAEANK